MKRGKLFLNLILAGLVLAGFVNGFSAEKPVPSGEELSGAKTAAAEKCAFFPDGVRLPGPELLENAGFEIVDWNKDGKKDVFLMTGSAMLFYVYYNEGANDKPEFGFAQQYPLNITELKNGLMYQNQTFLLTDWDNDGDLDFIFWGPDLRLVLNTGAAWAPNHINGTLGTNYFPASRQVIGENTRGEARGPESAHSGGLYSRAILQAAVGDWDGDGKKDLLVSRFKTGDKGQRGLYFYKNIKEDNDPYFEQGEEILDASGNSIEAPNPFMVDWNNDGHLDVISSEAPYWCNAFRVEWECAPYIKVFLRASGNPLKLNSAVSVKDKKGQDIKPGLQAKFIDWNEDGKKDLIVLDAGNSLLVYKNVGSKETPLFENAPEIVTGRDFGRHDGMTQQPFFVDWDRDGKKDLILCGAYDNHCSWARRRITLYKNTGKEYVRLGFLTYRGDPNVFPEDPQKSRYNFYDCYGSAVFVTDFNGDGKNDLLYTVGNRLFLFTGLKENSLDFQEMTEILLFDPKANQCRGWQTITFEPMEVKYIKLSGFFNSSPGGRFFAGEVEAYGKDGNTNYCLSGNGAVVAGNKWQDINLLIDGDTNKFAATPLWPNPAVITLKDAVVLDKIKVLLPDSGSQYLQYKLEISFDNKDWKTLADRRDLIYRVTPYPIDWDRDGNKDLVLGIAKSVDSLVARKEVEFRFYRNFGSDAKPEFDFNKYKIFTDGKIGTPLTIPGNCFCDNNACFTMEDWDKDGVMDLFIQDNQTGKVMFYKNVSENQLDFKFAYVRDFGNPPIFFNAVGYKTFFLGDIDGDGIDDLVVYAATGILKGIGSGCFGMWYFKGVAPGVPPPVDDLELVSFAKGGVVLEWTPPGQAGEYELRYSLGPVDDINWNECLKITGAYHPKGGKEQATVKNLAKGKTYFFAVKSLNKNGLSPISNLGRSVTPPLKMVELQNGKKISMDGAGGDYQGCQDACVQAMSSNIYQNSKGLTVKSMSGLKTLVRFEIPPGLQGKEIVSAELNLTLNGYNSWYWPGITCYEIKNDWDEKTVTGSFLDKDSGKFVSLSWRNPGYGLNDCIKCDVSDLLKKSLKNKEKYISLCLQEDPPASIAEWNFYDNESRKIAVRPKLSIIFK